MSTKDIYYGEYPCQGIYKSGKKKGLSCENKAYFDLDGTYLCGIHAKKEGVRDQRSTQRYALPKNPNKKQNQERELLDHEEECEQAAKENLQNGYRGDIKVTKLRMRKAVPHISGYVKIFPNFKHGNRKDGIGMPSLSPMSLGPIEHGYKDLPPALNLENFHQGAKFFPGEVDKEGAITQEAYEMRKKIYLDPTPYRHKFEVPYYTGEKVKRNKNIPLFSIHYKEDEEVRYSYLQSRYFYSHWYEKLAKKEGDFTLLNTLIDNGFNLLIIGYDGFPVEEDEALWKHYNDTTRPFGHELVLYTLLTIEDPNEYPWNRYYRENNDLYEGVI